jgi:hypothetical protein
MSHVKLIDISFFVGWDRTKLLVYETIIKNLIECWNAVLIPPNQMPNPPALTSTDRRYLHSLATDNVDISMLWKSDLEASLFSSREFLHMLWNSDDLEAALNFL